MNAHLAQFADDQNVRGDVLVLQGKISWQYSTSWKYAWDVAQDKTRCLTTFSATRRHKSA